MKKMFVIISILLLFSACSVSSIEAPAVSGFIQSPVPAAEPTATVTLKAILPEVTTTETIAESEFFLEDTTEEQIDELIKWFLVEVNSDAWLLGDYEDNPLGRLAGHNITISIYYRNMYRHYFEIYINEPSLNVYVDFGMRKENENGYAPQSMGIADTLEQNNHKLTYRNSIFICDRQVQVPAATRPIITLDDHALENIHRVLNYFIKEEMPHLSLDAYSFSLAHYDDRQTANKDGCMMWFFLDGGDENERYSCAGTINNEDSYAPIQTTFGELDEYSVHAYNLITESPYYELIITSDGICMPDDIKK